MRTTIDLPDPLFREVKTRAIQEGVKLKDLVAAYIAAGLQADLPQAEKNRSRSPLPVFRKPAHHQIPTLSNSEIASILDEEDFTTVPKRQQH